MSTRATYLFKGADKWSPNTTFYIHHDGYEEGAAHYFLAMTLLNDTAMLASMTLDYTKKMSGGLAEAFLRANLNAEFTRSHAAHGDTEYEYDVMGTDLVARKGYDDKKTVFYVGTLAGFINTHAKLKDDARVGLYNGHLMTLGGIVTLIEAKKESLLNYERRFPTMIGNIGGMKADIERAESAYKLAAA